MILESCSDIFKGNTPRITERGMYMLQLHTFELILFYIETRYSTQPCNSFMDKEIPTEYLTRLLDYTERDCRMKRTQKHFTFTVNPAPHQKTYKKQ